jgi:antitoxin component YwqK of YwqJK toxin-antitoxin module
MNSYIKKGLLLFVVLASVTACNRVKTTPEIKETYADGKPKIIVEYITEESGKKILYKETHYFPGGEKKHISGLYNNSQQRSGIWTSWYENGQKNSEYNFIDGKEDGVYNVWHSNGNQYIKGKYDMGKEVGIWTFHDTLGKVMKEVDFGGK